MNKDNEYQRVLNDVRDEGYAECTDKAVRIWLGVERIRRSRKNDVSNALTNDLKGEAVTAIFPTNNHRDKTVRFLKIRGYDFSELKWTEQPPPQGVTGTLSERIRAKRLAKDQGTV